MSKHASRPTLSVAIPTRNRRSLLPQMLEPVLSDVAVDEVVIVVDGSNDGSSEWLRGEAEKDPRLVVVVHERPSGAQAARARALDIATSDVVLFLDDDVVAGPGLASAHLSHHVDGDGLVVIGYMPVAVPDRRGPGQFASYLYRDEYEKRCIAYESDPAAVLRTLWWGNVSLRRHDAQGVGLLSEGFGSLYHEDQDFGLRCEQYGLGARFDRSLRATHLHHRDLQGFVKDARSQGAGRVLVHRRHPNLLGPLDTHAFDRNLPWLAGALVRAAKARRVAMWSTVLLGGAVRAFGRLRWYDAETSAARLLRRVNQRFGAQIVLEEAEPPAGPNAGGGLDR